MTAPRYSVILPYLNPGPLIVEAIRSMQRQSLPGWELIAVDDGSCDGAPRIVQDWARADPRIRPVRLQRNMGAAAARNIGMELARGDYLCFLDADDLLTDGALAAFERTLAGRDLDLVKGQIAVTHAAADAVPGTAGKAFEAPQAEALRGRILPLSDFTTHAVRRGFVRDCAIRFEEGLTLGEDRMFLARAQLWCASFAATDEVVYVYRKQFSSTMETLWTDPKRLSTMQFLTRMRALIDSRPQAERLRMAFFLNSFPWQCRLLARSARALDREAVLAHAAALRAAAVDGIDADDPFARRFSERWPEGVRRLRARMVAEEDEALLWQLATSAQPEGKAA